MEAAPNGPTPRLNTIEEVMERLRIGRSTAFELIGTRQLRSIKVGRRRLVSEAALIEFIERLDHKDASEQRRHVKAPGVSNGVPPPRCRGPLNRPRLKGLFSHDLNRFCARRQWATPSRSRAAAAGR